MNRMTAPLTGIMVLLMVTAAYAPEIGFEESGGVYDLAYRIGEDGRIVDRGGSVKGWMIGSEVYGKDWSLKYKMRGNRLCRVSGARDEGFCPSGNDRRTAPESR
jgi:hypothetical protein